MPPARFGPSHSRRRPDDTAMSRHIRRATRRWLRALPCRLQRRAGTALAVGVPAVLLAIPASSAAGWLGVRSDALWLLHVAAIPLLALRWRARGVAVGMLAGVLVLLAVET